MILETDFATLSEAATRADITDLIGTLGTGDRSLALLLREEQVYIQAAYLADRDLFSLDYRDGGPSRHYEVTGPTRAVVLAAFLSFHADDDDWRTMVEWRRDTHYEQLG